MAELLLGQPLFPGESSVDQLVEIIKVRGVSVGHAATRIHPHHTHTTSSSCKKQIER